jgi:hypothetical protein
LHYPVAKRGRKPKGCTVDQLDAELREKVDEAIRSHAGESSASIYRRFGLAQRGIHVRTFRRYAADIRERAVGERPGEPPAGERRDEADMIAELRRRVLVEALASLDAGASKPYEMVGMLSRVQEWDRIEIERAAAKRAEEKQAAWRREEEAKLSAAKVEADSKLDQMAVERGIPEDVAERIKDLYGLKIG